MITFLKRIALALWLFISKVALIFLVIGSINAFIVGIVVIVTHLFGATAVSYFPIILGVILLLALIALGMYKAWDEAKFRIK